MSLLRYKHLFLYLLMQAPFLEKQRQRWDQTGGSYGGEGPASERKLEEA